MRQCFTAVLEQGNVFTANFETEAFEAGWAREARWFIRVLEASEDMALEATPEISPDGIVWCTDGTQPDALRPAAGALHSFVTREFGNWLRLAVRLRGAEARTKLVIYLVLKE